MDSNSGLRSKLNYFTDIQPLDYSVDTNKHLYYADYTHLDGVEWQQETTLHKTIAILAIVLLCCGIVLYIII